MMALRSYIPDLQHGLACELLLEVQVVVLHIRSLDVAVEAENVALKAASGRRRVHRTAGNDGAAGRARRKNRLRSYVVVCRSGIKERCIRQVPQNHVLREGVEEHAPPGADHRFTLAAHVPSHTDTRGTVPVARVVTLAQSRLP